MRLWLWLRLRVAVTACGCRLKAHEEELHFMTDYVQRTGRVYASSAQPSQSTRSTRQCQAVPLNTRQYPSVPVSTPQ